MNMMMVKKSKKCKAMVKKAFESAESFQEMLKAFKQMETCFKENELGLECWKLAQKIYTENGDQVKIISYGKRALLIFLNNEKNNLPCFGTTHAHGSHGPPMFIACNLLLLGSACYALKRYRESLGYLNWSVRSLEKLVDEDEDEACPTKCVLHYLHEAHVVLYKLKVSMGRSKEAVPHKRAILEIKAKYKEEGSLGLGLAYKDVYEAYMRIMNFRDALPFCLKALEIFSDHYCYRSTVVALIRMDLGVIYNSVGKYEKALEQNQLAMRVLALCPVHFNSENLFDGEIERGYVLIDLDRNEEAIDVLKSVISCEDVQGARLAMAYITLAKAFCNLKNFADVHNYMNLGSKILEEEGMNPIFVACGFVDLSGICMIMDDYDTAITVTKKVLALPELPEMFLLQASHRLFELYYQSGRVGQGIPYMEDATEKLKEKFGPKHCQVGYSYIKFAIAYEKIGSLESCLEHFIIAKEILDVSLGPNHLDSLKTSQSVACTYATMQRYRQAIKYQQKVVEGLAGLGKSEEDKLKEAIRLLKEMKVRARGTDPQK